MKKELQTRANINDYLINYVGLSEDDVAAMPEFVKRDLVADKVDEFEDYIEGNAC